MTALANLASDLPELSRHVLQAGIGLALQSTLLLLAGLLAGRLLRGRSPAATAAVYRVTLAAVVLSAPLSAPLRGWIQPGWTLALPRAPGAAAGTPLGALNARVIGAAATLQAMLTGGPGLGLTRSAAGAATRTPRRSGGSGRAGFLLPPRLLPPSPGTFPAVSLPAISLSWLGWLYAAAAALWAGGAALLLACMALGGRTALRLRHGSAPVAEGDAAEMLQRLCEERHLRPPLLLVSAGIQGPVLTGLWRPAIILPASYERDFDRPALRAVLAHELAHLARGDCGWILLGRLACAFGWVQPLLWFLCRRL